MKSRLEESLDAQVHRGAYAYTRNLVAAEAAVQRGQFNAAKVLRASAHAYRILAMTAARLIEGQSSPLEMFKMNVEQLSEMEQALKTQEALDPDVEVRLKRSAIVQARARDLLLRSIESLKTHPDVMESDVAQSLWGCYSCGYIAEGDRPDACIVCGALGAEFEWFGPFYAATPEHLGQLTPLDILTTLEAVPASVAETVSGVGDEVLSRKPSEQEWCAKEIIGHMLETDILFARRVTTLLEAQGVPDLTTPIPPWKLHEGKGYEKMPVPELLERLTQARSASLAIVRDLKPAQWSRRGTLRGTSTSLIDLGTWLANHDRGHIAQLRRLRGG